MDETFTDVPLDLEFEVAEMLDDPKGGIVKLNQNRVQELLDIYKDETPQFAVLRVRAGKSGNGNDWPDTILKDVAEQVNQNEPLGYMGHIKPQDRGYVFPEPQTIWLGAKVVSEGNRPTLYVKGYLLPKTKTRDLVISGIVKTASWAGKASGKVVGGARKIERFVLESIDWARPGSNGMDSRVVAVVTEQEGGDKVEWGSLTLDDVEKNNPSLFALMKQKVEGESAGHVSEMEAKAQKADEAESVFQKLRKLLGIDDKADVVEAVTTLQERVDNISTGELKAKIADLLTGKLKNPKARQTVLRLIPVTEMEGKTDDELKDAVEGLLDTDEDIKAVVTEMEQSPAPLAQGRRERGNTQVGQSGMVVSGSRKL